MYRTKAIRRPATVNMEPSKTDQSFKDDCDVNIVLQRFMKTGDQSIFRQGGSYADVSEVPDLLESHLNLQRAKLAFDQLPALVRKKLENNPLMLEQYLLDPNNHEEAIELGLINPPPQKTEAHPPKNQNQEQQTTKTKSNESAPKNENKKSTPQDKNTDD